MWMQQPAQHSITGEAGVLHKHWLKNATFGRPNWDVLAGI
jgi:hypothetical protein